MEPSAHYAIKGLRKKIILSSVVYTLIALLTISTLSIFPFFRWLRHFEENNLAHAAEIRALAVEEYLSRMAEITRQINSRSAIRQALMDHRAGRLAFEELSRLTPVVLGDALNISQEVVGITRLDEHLQLIAQVGQAIPLRKILENPPADSALRILDPLLIDGTLYLAVWGPISHRDEPVVIGYDLVLFTTNKLQRIVWNESGLGTSGESFLARDDQGGTILFFPSRKGREEVYNLRLDPFPLQPAVDQAALGQLGTLCLEDTEEKKVVAFAPVGITDWVLLVTMDQAELLAPLNRQIFAVAGLTLLFAALGTLGLLTLLRPMTGRVLVHAEELDTLNRHLQMEIGERKRAESSLRRSENEWERTFEAITDAVAIIDNQGQVVKMNRAATSLLHEISPQEPPGRCCQELFGLTDQVLPSPYALMVAEKLPQCGEIHQPALERWFHVAYFPLLEDDNSLRGAVLIAHDVTEKRRMEKMKDDMLSTVSHEMRTPLTAMLGFVEFMLENPVDREQQVDFLRTVHRETERLNELISNFLDLQRLRAELESYQFAPMDPCVLLSEAAQLFRVASKKHLVRFDCPLDLPKIHGDEKRLMQVLKNLLSNAIKYSPAGGEVFLGAKGQTGQVLVWVRDHGMGIPAQDREKIFERFFRVDDSVKRIAGGIGLGLSLVREIIRAHGGKVWVESELGVGSTFYFSLPVGKPLTKDN